MDGRSKFRPRLAGVLLLVLLVWLTACATSMQMTPPDRGMPPPVEETAPALPEPTETVAAQAEAEATMPAATQGGLCPEVGRPALLLNPSTGGEPYLNMVSLDGQVECELALAAPLRGPISSAAGSLYYALMDAEAQTGRVWQLTPDGANQPLDFTATEGTGMGIVTLLVSPDGSKIAWGTQESVGPGEFATYLWVADIDGSNKVALLDGVAGEGGFLVPQAVRFSADNSTLYYAFHPQVHHPIWSFTTGRYGNLYHVPVTGGDPELLFDCQSEGLSHCIGDLSLDESAIAYTDTRDGTIKVRGINGEALGTITPPAMEYIGPALFYPAREEVVFTSAQVQESSTGPGLPLPMPGFLSRAQAPYTGEPEALAGLDSITQVLEWVDGPRLAAFYVNSAQEFGVAVVSVDRATEPVLIPMQSFMEFAGVIH